jgi:VanZ family protein
VIRAALWATLLLYAAVLLYPFKLQPPRWLKNGAQYGASELAFPSRGIALTKEAPRWLAEAIAQNRLAVTIELRSLKKRQFGPARIIAVSEDTQLRNFDMGQQGAHLSIRVRTERNDKGMPPFLVRDVFTSDDWHTIHMEIVSGRLLVSVDGEVRLERPLSAAPMATWDPDMRLALGNELTGNRPWRGEIRKALIAVGEKAVDYARPGALAVPARYWRVHDRRPNLVPPTRTSVWDAAQNTALFLPFGFLLRLRFRRDGWAFALLAIALAGAVSGMFEVLQLGIKGRHSSASDVLFNTLGAAIGYHLPGFLKRQRPAAV